MIFVDCAQALARSLLYPCRVQHNAHHRNHPHPRRFTMQTLIIKDLAATAELDSKAMRAVRGGTG
ncbi:MAG TPA: hypothetical protein VJ652_21955, partial [Noviherbaspirillum sp.]|nr:hypothetical protein [Noviherbaspirillum sp.]